MDIREFWKWLRWFLELDSVTAANKGETLMSVSQKNDEPPKWTLGKRLGGGGQGDVYEAVAPDGKRWAVKFYKPRVATQQQQKKLEQLIATKPASDAFLWPVKVTHIPHPKKRRRKAGLGYIMPLMDERFRPVTDIIEGKCDVSIRILLITCLNIATAIFQLHLKGLHYCDLKPENIFFDPLTGEVLFADADNITWKNDSYLGTIGTMAPEMKNGKVPNCQFTERFALAVVIFSLLIRQNPFHGKKLDSVEFRSFKDDHKHLLCNPLFNFHPTDPSNHLPPMHFAHQMMKVFSYLRPIFEAAFVDGLHNRELRPMPTQWILLLSGALGRITYCTKCCAENVLSASSAHCWNCQHKLRIFGRLKIYTPFAEHRILVTKEAAIYPGHLVGRSKGNYREALAVCESYRRNAVPTQLRNCSPFTWDLPTKKQVVQPGDALSLREDQDFLITRNVRVNFRRLSNSRR